MPRTSSLFSADRPIAGRTVLQIVPELESGGAERTTLEMAEALVQAGARALVAAQGGRLVADLQALGGEFIAFPAATKNPFAMMANVRRLAALVVRENVDILHARSRAPAWVALGAARRAGVRFVTTYHGVYSAGSPIKGRYNSVMAMGDCVIANSEFTARHVAERYPSAAARIVAIHRGVDLAAFAPEAVSPERVRATRDAWAAPPDERIILLPARLARRKGHGVLIEAAKILRGAGRSDLAFVFAGDEEGEAYARDLDRAVSTAGLAGVVRRVGYCADMPAAYMSAACVVAPSTEPEAFGRIAVEAQAMGVPVVVSDLGASAETVLAPPDVAAAARTGWRVPSGDPTALAAAIGEALDLRAAARESLSLRARANVRDRFSTERMRARTLAVYESLLAGPPRLLT